MNLTPKQEVVKIVKKAVFFIPFVLALSLPKSAYAVLVGWDPECVEDNVPTFLGFKCLLKNIIASVLGIAGIVLFVMLIFGGFRYLTAGADPEAAESAKKIITYAVLGFVMLIVSYLIILLIAQISGVQFKVDFK